MLALGACQPIDKLRPHVIWAQQNWSAAAFTVRSLTQLLGVIGTPLYSIWSGVIQSPN